MVSQGAGRSLSCRWGRKLIAGVAIGFGVVGAATADPAREPTAGYVVFEPVETGGAFEAAGFEPGDLLVAWSWTSGDGGDAVGGPITSFFEAARIDVEYGSRGSVTFDVIRRGARAVVEIELRAWNATAWRDSWRPHLDRSSLELYRQGQEAGRVGDVEDSAEPWRRAAESPHLVASSRAWLWRRIGKIYEDAERQEDAHGAYRAALSSAQGPAAKSWLQDDIAAAYQRVGALAEVESAVELALDATRLAWEESLFHAFLLNRRCKLLVDLGRLDEAESCSRKVLEMASGPAPESLIVAEAEARLGVAAFDRGLFEEAEKRGRRALEIRSALVPEGLEVAASLNNLGNVNLRRGEWPMAGERYRQSLAIRRRLAVPRLVLSSLGNLAIVAAGSGDLRKSADMMEEVIVMQRDLLPGTLRLANTLGNLSRVYKATGDLDRASALLAEALEILRRVAPGSPDLAGVLVTLGTVELERGLPERGVDVLQEAEAIYEQAKVRDGRSNALNLLGSAYRELGEVEKGIETHEKALSLATPEVASAVLINLGRAAFHDGEIDKAAEYFSRARENFKGVSISSAQLADGEGKVALAQGNFERAAERYQHALDLARRSHLSGGQFAESYRGLANVRRKQGRLQEALDLYYRSLEELGRQTESLGSLRGSQGNYRARSIHFYRLTASLELELGLIEEAFLTLEKSRAQSFLAQLSERDLLLSDVPAELEQARLRNARDYDRVQFHMGRLDPESEGETIESLRARLRELRKEREELAEKIFVASPRSASLHYPLPIALDAARRSLDPGTAMLAYSVGESETLLFVVGRETEPFAMSLAVGEEALRDEVGKILRLQSTRSSAPYVEPMREAGEKLYQELIAPVESRLAAAERLLIVPDGPLHLLPFSLLIRRAGEHGESGDVDYLIEWKAISTVLSATVQAELVSRRQESTTPGVGRGGTLVAFADPATPTGAEDGEAGETLDAAVRGAVSRGFDFRPLPYSRGEVKRVAALMPGDSVKIWLGAEASEGRAKAIGKEASVLHFATHGRYDDRFSMNSFLALAHSGDGSRDENGLLQAWEIIEEMRLDAELVVLSACESGLGGELDGEGLIGLSRAFQFAGARTVVATLWQVADQASAELMTRFYRHLAAGLDKADALRAAQLELIAGPIELERSDGRRIKRDLSLPYFWAGYQMSGDWR